MGAGHMVTAACALGGALAAHLGSRAGGCRQLPGMWRLGFRRRRDQAWYPESEDEDEEDTPRGLDSDTIEGHTFGHVYAVSASSTALPGGREEETKCMVCMEQFVVGEALRVLPCLHRYHQRCIDEWLSSRSPECPICKRDITDTAVPLEPPRASSSLASVAGREV